MPLNIGCFFAHCTHWRHLHEYRELLDVFLMSPLIFWTLFIFGDICMNVVDLKMVLEVPIYFLETSSEW